MASSSVGLVSETEANDYWTSSPSPSQPTITSLPTLATVPKDTETLPSSQPAPESSMILN